MSDELVGAMDPFFLNDTLPDNSTGRNTCLPANECVDGLIIPRWHLPPPDSHENRELAMAYRAIVYGLGLLYLLLGVSIITEKIVAATEFMAAHRRTVTVQLKSGNETTVKLPVWHPVVAALSFGVIGTTSPEILVPIIEIFKNHFQGNQLGPSLIIGSAAYRMFVITGVCLFSVRESSGKAIKDLSLFFLTGAFAIFAPLWIFVLLDIISPDVIEFWEAVVTILMYPALLLAAWIVARRFPFRLINALTNLNLSMHNERGISPTLSTTSSVPDDGRDIPDTEGKGYRRLLKARIKELREEYPDKSRQDVVEMAKLEIFDDTLPKKSFMHYRASTSKEKESVNINNSLSNVTDAFGPNKDKLELANVQYCGFSASRQSCIESCGSVSISVQRSGAGIDCTALSLDYETIPETAKANANYRTATGRIIFGPGEDRAEINVTILDDGIYELVAKVFKIKLSRPMIERMATPVSTLSVPTGHSENRVAPASLNLSKVSRVDLKRDEITIAILDDDHCGVFAFEKPEIPVPDNVAVAKIKVTRSVGTKGFVRIPYRISNGTAKADEDYIAPANGILPFVNGQYEAFIEIRIVDKDRFGEVFNFYIELLAPRKESSGDVKSTVRLPTLGTPNLVQVGICEVEETREALDRLLKTPEVTATVIQSRWKDQFLESIAIARAEDESDYATSMTRASRSPCTYYVIPYCYHILAFPWKLLVAIFPPAHLFNGWMSYISLLCLMTAISVLIGDCASLFACSIGLKETVTAITIIPFVLDIPDLLASRRAAIHEKTADASIGSIFGSNAVGMLLGMGLPWAIASIYQMATGSEMKVASGDLSFSVMLYCTFSVAGILVLLFRRLPPIRGELGGPNHIKYLSGTFFLILWILFIVLSSLESYCYISGFKLHGTA